MLRGWIKALDADYQLIAVDPHAAPTLADIGQHDPRLEVHDSAASLPRGLHVSAVVFATKKIRLGRKP